MRGRGSWHRGAESAIAGEDGRTAFEALLVLVLVGGLILTVADRYIRSVKIVKENALMIELSNLRSAISLYVVFKRRLPGSLKDLLKEDVIFPKRNVEGRDYEIVVSGTYIKSMTMDEEGEILDAFGNRFHYDPETGKVHSTTEGYESW